MTIDIYVWISFNTVAHVSSTIEWKCICIISILIIVKSEMCNLQKWRRMKENVSLMAHRGYYIWETINRFNYWWWVSSIDLVCGSLVDVYMFIIPMWWYFRPRLSCWTNLFVGPFKRIETVALNFLLSCKKLKLRWKLLDRPLDWSSSLSQYAWTWPYLGHGMFRSLTLYMALGIRGQRWSFKA